MAQAETELTGAVSPAHQPPAKTAAQGDAGVGEPEPGKKDSPSRGRQILLLGCAMIVLIILCLVMLGVLGIFAGG